MKKLAILLLPLCLVSLGSCGSSSESSGESTSQTDSGEYLEFTTLTDGTLGVKQGNSGYLSNVVIPSVYQNKIVTRILAGGFIHDKDTIKTIVLPTTLQVIEDYAFQGRNMKIEYPGTTQQFEDIVMDYPKAFAISDSLVMVGGEEYTAPDPSVKLLEYFPLDDGTFGVKEGNTRNLNLVTIPETHDGVRVSRILDGAFYHATGNVKTVVIPKTITVIDNAAFSGWNFYIEYLGTVEEFEAIDMDFASAFKVSESIFIVDGKTYPDGQELPDDLSQGDSITYWCPNIDSNFFQKKAYEFKRLHPEFKGEITSLGVRDEGDIRGELIKDPENAADVFEMVDDYIPDCADAGVLTAFEDDDIEIIKDNYSDIPVVASSYKKKVYGVPYRSEVGYVLSYDTSIISAEQAKTVEGIIEACKAAGATFNFNLTNSWYTFSPIWAVGGKTYTDDDGKYHCEIATEEVAEAAAGFAKIVADAGTTWNHSDDDSGFGAASGRVGAVIKWENEKAEAEKLGDKLAITTLPSFTVEGKSYQLKSFQSFKTLNMRKASAFTKAKKITARAFCLYMGSDEVAKERLTTLKQGVTNTRVIAEPELWSSKWNLALANQQVAGNTISQVNGSTNMYWSAAEAFGNALKGGALVDKEAMLAALTACQTAQNM